MGIKLWLVASILAASFTTVATAQEIDWKKVDDVCRGCSSFRANDDALNLPKDFARRSKKQRAQ